MSAPGRLRIAGGVRRGARLKVPAGIRPTSERLRESLFNIWRPRLAGAGFLDLFAGSGAVGLEALSRGATGCLLLEDDRRVLVVLERNLAEIDLPGARAVRARLPGGLAAAVGPDRRFELIFADPPYGFPRLAELLAAAAPLLAPGGELALEHDRRQAPPAAGGFEAESRTYGDSALTFYRRREPVAGEGSGPAP